MTKRKDVDAETENDFIPTVRTVTVRLKSAAPYSQSKHIVSHKKEGELDDAFEKRTWRERCHGTTDGHILIPPMQFKWSLATAAKYMSEKIKGKQNMTWTKHFLSGVLVPNELVLDYKVDEIFGEELFVPANGKRGSGSRVMRTFPRIPEWEGDVTYIILDPLITPSIFEKTLVNAGQFIGIGRFRPENGGYYGRYMPTPGSYRYDSQ